MGDFQRLTSVRFYPLTVRSQSQIVAEVAASWTCQRIKLTCPRWGRTENELSKPDNKLHKHPHLLCSHTRLPLSVCMTHNSDDWEKVIHVITLELYRRHVQTKVITELQFPRANLIPNAFNTVCHSVTRIT